MSAAACGSDDSGAKSDDDESASQQPSTRADGGKGSADAGTKKDGGKTSPGNGGGGNTGPAFDDAGNELCSSRVVTATAQYPDVLIVLDASLSMLAARWAPSVNAITQLTQMYQANVAFGLSIFPAGGLPSCSQGNYDVMTALNTSDKIGMVMNATRPAGFTPTGPALDAALKYLGDRTQSGADQAQSTAPAYVLLVTDGEPDCPGDPVGSVTNLANAGIPTYVVGYNIDPVGQALMNQMAQVGMTDHFYDVENPADLNTAFAMISKSLVSCEFDLDQTPDNPSYVLVTIDGKQVVLDAADGWVIDGTHVRLQGGSCDTLKDGQPHTLHVGIECTPVQVM